jgi:hypothetical protein
MTPARRDAIVRSTTNDHRERTMASHPITTPGAEPLQTRSLAWAQLTGGRLALLALALLACGVAAAVEMGRNVLAFWVATMAFPLVTPAGLAIAIQDAVMHGTWVVAGFALAAAVTGVASFIKFLGSLDEL